MLVMQALRQTAMAAFMSIAASSPAPAPAATAVHAITPVPASQVVVISAPAPGATQATLTTYAWAADHWQVAIGPVPAWVGTNGLTNDPHEADGFTPGGEYSITTVFGSQPDPGTHFTYVNVDDDDHWVDDPTSPVYNTWQRGSASGRWRSAENLSAYPYAAAFDFNQNPVVPNGNSAIFLHEGTAPTPGCIVVSRNDLLAVLRWLDPVAQPRIVIGVNVAPPVHLAA
jgi:L,D-peptidoglycan transpeptidase YkuD (ErfK/YbiS/YcfS/YnhG family)